MYIHRPLWVGDKRERQVLVPCAFSFGLPSTAATGATNNNSSNINNSNNNNK